MSQATLAHLLASNPSPFAEAALAWLGMADDFDNASETFVRGTRDLPDAWREGDASEAAQWRAATLRAELSNVYQPARRIGLALQRFSEGMAQLRGYAEQIIAAAHRDGLRVDVASGMVSAPAEMYQGGAPDHTARLVNSYVIELNTVVERARGLDDETVRVINENLPDPVLGFGTAVPLPVSQQDVQAQQGRDPLAVRLWWESLTPTQQEQAITEFPELVGWLDGVPATDRDTANRLRLPIEEERLRERAEEIREQIATMESAFADSPDERRAWHEQLQRLRDDLSRVELEITRLDKVEETLARLGDQGLLMGFDPAGDGKAVIAVGNPDTASHTAVWVPGVGTTLDGVDGNVDRVQDLQREADRLKPTARGDVSAIMWLGYDAPEMDASAVTHDRSKQGGAALDAFVNGLNVSHAGGEQHITAVGHSYGSTVVAEAAKGPGGLTVGDIVVAGSPGMHADHASQLNTDPRHVWAGSAPGDFVSDMRNQPSATDLQANPGPVGALAGGAVLGWELAHGDSPHRPEFGANRFHVDTTGHSDYWKEGTRSLRNQALIVVGRYDDVVLDHGSPPS